MEKVPKWQKNKLCRKKNPNFFIIKSRIAKLISDRHNNITQVRYRFCGSNPENKKVGFFLTENFLTKNIEKGSKIRSFLNICRIVIKNDFYYYFFDTKHDFFIKNHIWPFWGYPFLPKLASIG